MKGISNLLLLIYLSTVLCYNEVNKVGNFSRNQKDISSEKYSKFAKYDVDNEMRDEVSEVASKNEGHAKIPNEEFNGNESTQDTKIGKKHLSEEEEVIHSNPEPLTDDFERESENGERKKPKRAKIRGRNRGKYKKYTKENGRREIFSSGEDFRDGTHQEFTGDPTVIGSTNAADNDSLNSTNHSSVNHYICMVEEDMVPESELVLYGMKAWTFSQQDVNLTLAYPTTTDSGVSDLADSNEESSENLGYIITGFKVMMYVDGIQSRGFIVRGGVLQDSLTLSFVSTNITSLLYKFWLYGVPKTSVSESEINTWSFSCT